MNFRVIVTCSKSSNTALENGDRTFKCLSKRQWKPLQVALEKLIAFWIRDLICQGQCCMPFLRHYLIFKMKL